jgi:rhamnulokinase
MKYRFVLEKLESLLGRRLDLIHVVGGGCQNVLLCQLTADVCNRVVVAGPVEATAVGNVLTQALGLGLIASLEELREVVRRSFDPVEYVPGERGHWDEVYGRFVALMG